MSDQPKKPTTKVVIDDQRVYIVPNEAGELIGEFARQKAIEVFDAPKPIPQTQKG
jgi:hypothetical protein